MSAKRLFSTYSGELKRIGGRLESTTPREIPRLFAGIPLEIFGSLIFETPKKYKKIKDFLPAMPDAAVQTTWNGRAGAALLPASLAFVQTVLDFAAGQRLDLGNVNFLDFGCGWGRFLRLFLKYIPEERLFGVDPLDRSLEQCRITRVRGNLAQTDHLCRSLPFEPVRFDLVIAFSVFTHLSEKAAAIALETIRARMSPRSFLILTVRPIEFWRTFHQRNPETNVAPLEERHRDRGFAFLPLPHAPLAEGEATFGDASISMEYVKTRWTGWELVGKVQHVTDPFQIIVFLKPRQEALDKGGTPDEGRMRCT